MNLNVASFVLAVMTLTHAHLGAADKLQVMTLHPVATELARVIGGEIIEVTSLMAPGTNPHDFNPSPKQIENLAKADLVLAAGKNLEEFLPRFVKSTGSKNKVLEIGNSVPTLKSNDEHHGFVDPHWWHSIKNMKTAASVVEQRLSQFAPGSQSLFANNRKNYVSKLDSLEKWAAKEIGKIPREKRKLVTSHDAFGYFAHNYGFRVYPIGGLTPADKPSSKKVADLVRLIKSMNVKAVFAENMENPKVLEMMMTETGSSMGGKLYADSFGFPPVLNYEEMYRHNVTTIVEGLTR